MTLKRNRERRKTITSFTTSWLCIVLGAWTLDSGVRSRSGAKIKNYRMNLSLSSSIDLTSLLSDVAPRYTLEQKCTLVPSTSFTWGVQRLCPWRSWLPGARRAVPWPFDAEFYHCFLIFVNGARRWTNNSNIQKLSMVLAGHPSNTKIKSVKDL